MKEWSAPTVMTVNKKPVLLACLLCLFGGTPPAFALDVVPSLYGLQQIVVHLAKMGNETASGNCGLSRREVSDKLLVALQNESLPVRSVLGVNANDTSLINVDLVPEVVTLKPQDKTCLSWVGFTVQSRNAIQISPAPYPRDVFLTYWKGGLLVGTTEHAHVRGINEAISKLAGQFARQFYADQPPDLSKQ